MELEHLTSAKHLWWQRSYDFHPVAMDGMLKTELVGMQRLPGEEDFILVWADGGIEMREEQL